MMWGYHGDNWGWQMLFGGIWMLVFWGGVILAVVWGVARVMGQQGTSPAPPEAPIDIAKRRLAAGEITPEQFEEIRSRLV
jgi:putative membrane protein